MSRLRSTLVVALIGAISMAAAVPREASPQPDPAAAKLNVDSADVNLSEMPSFTFAVTIPTVMHFQTFDFSGARYIRIYAISVDSLAPRIHRATSYLDSKPGIFTPLFDPPNRLPIVGYVDRAEFAKAVQRALRDTQPERRLSYNRRLTRS